MRKFKDPIVTYYEENGYLYISVAARKEMGVDYGSTVDVLYDPDTDELGLKPMGDGEGDRKLNSAGYVCCKKLSDIVDVKKVFPALLKWSAEDQLYVLLKAPSK